MTCTRVQRPKAAKTPVLQNVDTFQKGIFEHNKMPECWGPGNFWQWIMQCFGLLFQILLLRAPLYLKDLVSYCPPPLLVNNLFFSYTSSYRHCAPQATVTIWAASKSGIKFTNKYWLWSGLDLFVRDNVYRWRSDIILDLYERKRSFLDAIVSQRVSEWVSVWLIISDFSANPTFVSNVSQR